MISESCRPGPRFCFASSRSRIFFEYPHCLPSTAAPAHARRICVCQPAWLHASLSLGYLLYAVFKVRSCRNGFRQMGLSGLEPPTSRLSGVRSNRLSYKPFLIRQPPALPHRLQCSTIGRLGLNHRVRDGNGCLPQAHRHRKSRVIKFCGEERSVDSGSLLPDINRDFFISGAPAAGRPSGPEVPQNALLLLITQQ